MLRFRTMNTRISDHIQEGGRVFLPQWRMRQIRWEEAQLNSIAKREGLSGELHHMNCPCGSIACLGAPFIPMTEGALPEGCTEPVNP
jgi:hypothetical protein